MIKKLSKKYVRRCIKHLKEWGAPLSGWYCIDIFDIKEENEDDESYHTCELCDCNKVRFVHVMQNEYYFEDVEVGCICAGIMQGDIFEAQERERKMRNRAKRRKTFIKKGWEEDGCGYCRKYKGDMIYVYEKNDILVVSYKGKSVWKYKDKPIKDLLTATYAAFNLVDPVEKVKEI